MSEFADRLVAALARPYVAAPQVPVTASVGVAVADVGERDPGALLRSADLAMYEAKRGGRGRWSRYASHMHTELLARVELESELREGLHRGELVVHYQPVHHLRTGRPHGVEALVRWQHPRRSSLPPEVRRGRLRKATQFSRQPAACTPRELPMRHAPSFGGSSPPLTT